MKESLHVDIWRDTNEAASVGPRNVENNKAVVFAVGLEKRRDSE
jgi:hypothetical protein